MDLSLVSIDSTTVRAHHDAAGMTRYDKTPESYLAGLRLRASVIWIKDLTRTRAGSRAGHRGDRSCGL